MACVHFGISTLSDYIAVIDYFPLNILRFNELAS